MREEGEGARSCSCTAGPASTARSSSPRSARWLPRRALLAVDHRGNGRSDAGDPARWTVPQMADDVEALIARSPRRPVVIGPLLRLLRGAAATWRAHGTRGRLRLHGHCRLVDELLEIDEPARGLRARGAARAGDGSWAPRPPSQTPRGAAATGRGPVAIPRRGPRGRLVRRMQATSARVVFSPDVLRHFATGGEYGLVDNRERLSRARHPGARALRRARSHDAGRRRAPARASCCRRRRGRGPGRRAPPAAGAARRHAHGAARFPLRALGPELVPVRRRPAHERRGGQPRSLRGLLGLDVAMDPAGS